MSPTRTSAARPLVERATLQGGRQRDYCQASLTGKSATIESRAFEVSGHVQGVGFRPFVYRLATELGLTGEVCNRLGRVEIIAQGTAATLRSFEHRLLRDAPSIARPSIARSQLIERDALEGFVIRNSRRGDAAHIFVPPDYFLCPDCAAEQRDPGDRRYKYPFINCTQCGPRYTLIRSLPYDRANTSMASFVLCADCLAEYSDPFDRRFHAEPIACPACGPQLQFELSGEDVSAVEDSALAAALHELKSGHIVAVKGIGGYHLMCDASDPAAVEQLRQRKHRPDKPLAVMFPLAGKDGLQTVRESVRLSDVEADLLTSPMRPIVLAKKNARCTLAENLASGLNELGVFLPYSPLHELLLGEFGKPLVATSGNISGEPVLTDEQVARTRLQSIADAFLHHDRPIVRPADDPVYRSIDGAARPLRLGRGVAPLECELPWHQTVPTLCVGGHMKTTVALSWDNRVVVSPHIGEMDSPRSLAVFEQVVADLQDLYGVSAARIVCDPHRGYATHRWARQQGGLPVQTVWHHHAHASALVGESALPGPWLVFAWDGVGLGDDGTLWGGEALLGDAGSWQRVCSLRPFRPPGADRAGREPWRSAAAMLWESGSDWTTDALGYELARQAWKAGLNTPQTSAAGRVFDAAAALILGVHTVSFEAQGPMLLEARADKAGSPIALPLVADDSGVLRSDWQPLLAQLVDDRCDATTRAENFHSSMAQIILDQAVAIRERSKVQHVGLTGGVFQNRLLTEQATELLRDAGFNVHLNTIVPGNDAGLSFGQAAESAATDQRGRH